MKNLFISCFLLFTYSTHASNWVEVNHSKDAFFIDLDSIKKSSNFLFYSSLENMTSMGLNSVIVKTKANCAKRMVIESIASYYGQPMGKGDLIEEETLSDIGSPDPESKSFAVMKFACSYKK